MPESTRGLRARCVRHDGYSPILIDRNRNQAGRDSPESVQSDDWRALPRQLPAAGGAGLRLHHRPDRGTGRGAGGLRPRAGPPARQLGDIDAPEAWLRTVAVNVVRRRWRRKQLLNTILLRERPLTQMLEDAPEPDRADLREALADAAQAATARSSSCTIWPTFRWTRLPRFWRSPWAPSSPASPGDVRRSKDCSTTSRPRRWTQVRQRAEPHPHQPPRRADLGRARGASSPRPSAFSCSIRSRCLRSTSPRRTAVGAHLLRFRDPIRSVHDPASVPDLPGDDRRAGRRRREHAAHRRRVSTPSPTTAASTGRSCLATPRATARPGAAKPGRRR